jgi:hypothetical protein
MSPRRIFIIGATGAQGMPITKGLAQDNGYALRILTRDANSRRAQELKKLSHDIEFVEATFASEADLREGFRGSWGAYVNIDGFNSGEKTEMFWAMRAYEIAIEEGVKFFVYGNLDYAYKKSGYNPKMRSGHYDGKGRIGEWVLFQNQANRDRMGAAVLTSGPYIDMNISPRTIMTPAVQDGVVTWYVPLASGAIPFVALEDLGTYARWIFDNTERSNGMNLEVAMGHLTYHDIVSGFTAATGRPAKWVDIPMDGYFAATGIPDDAPAAYNADPKDSATLSFRANFEGFFNIWRESGDNKGVVTRDYALLDEIFPGRTRTAEEWFRREDERGAKAGEGSLFERISSGSGNSVLKGSEDGRTGRL